MNSIRFFAAGVFALSTPAVAADEAEQYLGLNEYRHVKPNRPAVVCGPAAWENGNYFPNGKENAARLFTPNDDTLTVKLKGAYFHYAPETSRWRPWMNKSEVQVGIFADISTKGTAMSAPGAGGIPGRLVFFSDNYILKQRRIADVNTNIYGPVMYTGGGLALKLTMLEFDQSKDDQLADSLMKSVAELGTKASAGVPAYLEGPLTTLFQAALSSAKSKDDIFGQLTFVLDDRNGDSNEPTSPLRTGDMVLVRQADRQKPIDWNTLCYDPATAEVFTDSTSRKPPALNYVSISLLKNAGADAGRIQDALTYERLVGELQQRKTDTGLIAGVTEVTSALKERATDRELLRQISIVGRADGGVSDLERSDAAALLGRVLYASQLAFNGFISASIIPIDECTFLKNEKVSADSLARLFVRLQGANNKYTRDSIDTLANPAPKNCVEANKNLLKVQRLLLNPT